VISEDRTVCKLTASRRSGEASLCTERRWNEEKSAICGYYNFDVYSTVLAGIGSSQVTAAKKISASECTARMPVASMS
jgi:hypothetical protein